MRIIYGTKVLTEEDLFDTCGRPKNIMDFIKMNTEQTLSDLEGAKYDFRSKQEFQSNEFKLSFIPIDVIEEYVMFQTICRSIDIAIDYMATTDSIEKAKLIAKAAKQKIDECIEYYADNMSKIPNSVCMVFIYDTKTNNIKDMCVTIPRRAIDKINAPMEYECTDCKYIERTDVLPDNMMYTIIDNRVVYYCNKCAEKMNYNFVHVGEEFN